MSTEDKSAVYQTLARNMTDSELARRLEADGDRALPEYKQEAIRRFGGFDIASFSPLQQAIKADIAEVLESSEAVRDAVDELQAELDAGRDFL